MAAAVEAIQIRIDRRVGIRAAHQSLVPIPCRGLRECDPIVVSGYGQIYIAVEITVGILVEGIGVELGFTCVGIIADPESSFAGAAFCASLMN